MDIYRDTLTVLTANGDVLSIDHNGRRIEVSWLEIAQVGGHVAEGSGFINPGETQPITDVVIETLSGPVIHLKVPADGNGSHLMAALAQFANPL